MTATIDFTSVLLERHSIKQYDPNVKMSKKEIKSLVELAQRAPSAWNLQPWKFLIVESDEHKQRLLPIANGQQQVVQASIVVAVLGDLQGDENAEPVYQQAVTAGFITEDIKNRLVGQIRDAYKNPSVAHDQAVLNASLAAMQLMLAAKELGYDSCPMGGFDPDGLVKEFRIPDRYIPLLLISVGKAAKPPYPSSRFPAEDVIVWNQF
ncbi:nitroreductase family protein [Paenibacillus thermotolerans]|uniref:nitroreductase family protein n=1 Tax=Paenibacillus thermotolerans TaxID=3027807 RepID=UPI002368DADC|nr:MULTISPECIES: nitroreductase family protein [unclassified Paenibacillus]